MALVPIAYLDNGSLTIELDVTNDTVTALNVINNYTGDAYVTIVADNGAQVLTQQLCPTQQTTYVSVTPQFPYTTGADWDVSVTVVNA